jgi:T5orf172 domain
MQFIDAVVAVIGRSGESLSPAEIRDRLKLYYPQFYGTDSHAGMVERGSCQSLDHALMLQVYNLAKNSRFICDRSSRPMKLSLSEVEKLPIDDGSEFVSAESIEQDFGVVYVLKTGTFTKMGKEIVKIGITSGDINSRVSQLFTTGVPYRFQVYAVYKITGFIEVERALHLLLNKYRLNNSREFFSDEVLPFVEKIVALHEDIVKAG